MITANLIAGEELAGGNETLIAINPAIQRPLPGAFTVATSAEVDAAATAAHAAWRTYQNVSGIHKAAFLRAIAEKIEALGDRLIDRAVAESGLPAGRIIGERGRTIGQLRSFADLVEAGHWVDATIDSALPERKPFPRVALSKMLVSSGPVAVFTASNFPLAFSTAGGDTASALAAGCPVIVKAHPSHLGTNALVSEAIKEAAEKTGMPSGVYSSVQGGIETGKALVMHPLVKAVGFTGSFGGGTALAKLAQTRKEPIPVYAEMGSNNPIFILPEKASADVEALAATLSGSVNLGAGQFCTNPGIIALQTSTTTKAFLAALGAALSEAAAQTMLNEGIYNNYEKGLLACTATDGVSLGFKGATTARSWEAAPAFAQTSAKNFLKQPGLQDEIFGPFTLVVLCEDAAELLAVADGLHGQLTATIMGTDQDMVGAGSLLNILVNKAGRVICNGVPTGVEVCPAMHHGGPYPSTTNALFTSVGTDAIRRFVRPVSFQNIPDALLPLALKAANPLNINRKVNGKMTL
jgi:NADP-dependent aldehyde dehydrogenase